LRAGPRGRVPKTVSESTQIQELQKTKAAGGLPLLLSRLRSYFFWDPLIWLYTIVMGILSLLCSLADRGGSIQHGFARAWSRMILGTIGVKVQVIGMEKIDLNQAHVYAVNHLSALDVPTLYSSLPFQFRILAKKELFSYPFMGWHLRRSGQIPIELGSVRATIRSLNQAAASLTNKMPLVIFPEGGRSPDGHLHDFMSGAFYIAIKAQADVVPMALVGNWEMLPMNTWHIQPRSSYLLVGDPISTKGMTVRQVDELTKKAGDVIGDLYYSRAAFADPRLPRKTQSE
jgi:1-acyl-sn-glycerol-3-phosphate acyltransferase